MDLTSCIKSLWLELDCAVGKAEDVVGYLEQNILFAVDHKNKYIK